MTRFMRTVASHSNDPTQVPAPSPTSAHDDALVLVQRGALQQGAAADAATPCPCQVHAARLAKEGCGYWSNSKVATTGAWSDSGNLRSTANAADSSCSTSLWISEPR